MIGPRRQNPPAALRTRRWRLALMCASPALALAISACGSSHAASPSHAQTTRVAAASATTKSAAPDPPPPVAHLRIISPRRGAHTAPNLTVRVAVTGASASGSRAFMYVLDGTLSRRGSARLTFHDLAPGRHHLLVALLARRSTRATVSFTVAAPPPPPSPGPASSAQPSTPALAPPTAAPPPPPTMTQPPAPTPAPPPSMGIPQGLNAGDGDADNNGAPSDGDGNV
jgi:hypothetical protein